MLVLVVMMVLYGVVERKLSLFFLLVCLRVDEVAKRV